MGLASERLSSSSIPGKANPNARNSEMGNPIRRSFSGNPFTKPSIVANPRGFNHNTPVNSPSENSRRNSMGRDTIVTLRHYEDKENGKDQKTNPSQVRSPMGSKGTKNFLSPTISAASKITQSPKKKILADKNETLRASIECKIPIFSQTVADAEQKKEEDDPTAPLNPKKGKTIRKTVTFSDSKIQTFSSSLAHSVHKEENLAPLKFDSVHDSKESLGFSENISEAFWEKPHTFNASEEPDCVNLDPSFKISPPAFSYGSLEFPKTHSDPSIPPYDPKTNYLSPRPQFLHYRPNPRVELYLSNEREGKRLEDSLISGSFSDSDATGGTHSEKSQKELEDVSSSEVIETQEKLKEDKEEEEEEEEELIVSEPSPAFLSEDIDESKSKPSFFLRKKFVALLMVLSFACLSVLVINSPVIDHSMFEESTFLKLYDQFEIAEFFRASYDGLDQNLRVWSSKSISFLAELISNLRGENKLGSFHYCNLTALLKDDAESNGYNVYDHNNGESGQFIVFGPTTGREVQIEVLEEKFQPEVEDSEEIEDLFSEMHIFLEYEGHDQLETEPLVDHISPNSEEVVDASKFEVAEPLLDHSNTDSKEVYEAPESELAEPQETDLSGQVSQVTESVTNLKDEPVLTSLADELQNESGTSSAAEEVEGLTVNGISQDSKENVLGFTYWLLPVIAVVVFTFMKRRNNTAFHAYNHSIVKPVVTKKLDSIDQNTFQDKPASWNWAGESYPSEMSSSGTSSSSCSKKSLRGLDKAESKGRKNRMNNTNSHRRESLASSSMDHSMGSPSYGSFTTYEKIPTKHGYGDEETITPVRRSSRIRNLVTSP